VHLELNGDGSTSLVGDTVGQAVEKNVLGIASVLAGGVSAPSSIVDAGSTSSTADDLVTVRHYTDDTGRTAITDSGNLRSGTYVTVPSEIQPSSGHVQIEDMLEIKPGRGTNYIDVQTPKSNLAIPANGPVTSGNAWQRQLIDPVFFGTSTWRRPPGRPSIPH
jgi:hypothetical protein